MSLLIKLNMVKWSGFYESIMRDEYNMKSIRIWDIFLNRKLHITLMMNNDDWIPSVKMPSFQKLAKLSALLFVDVEIW